MPVTRLGARLARPFPRRWAVRALSSSARPAAGELSTAVRRALEGIVGEQSVAYSQAVREQHCRDESYHGDTDGIFPPQVTVKWAKPD
jgi:hypothetical protein